MFPHRTLRDVTAALALASLLVVLPGCPFSPDDDDGDGKDTRIPPRNSVTGAIEQYAFVWKNKRLPEYERLLHDEFEYFPQSQDLIDFWWMNPGALSWGRTEEIGMARNMFDENFVSEVTRNSVDSIDMVIEILSQQNTPDGVEVLTHAVAQVLWAQDSGARSDVRFRFLVVPDPDEPGLFQIKTQWELPLF